MFKAVVLALILQMSGHAVCADLQNDFSVSCQYAHNSFIITYKKVVPDIGMQWMVYAQLAGAAHGTAMAFGVMYNYISVGILSTVSTGYIYMISRQNVASCLSMPTNEMIGNCLIMRTIVQSYP